MATIRRELSVEVLLRRDRAVSLAGLAALVALAWVYLLRSTREMGAMAEMGMARTAPWTPGDFALAVTMWMVMMVAMMLPTAAPMTLTFVTLNRRRHRGPLVSVGLFVLGYLGMWGAFSVGAAGVQWALRSGAWLAPETLRVTPLLGAGVLVAAGLYQLTPLKYACLARCQTPFGFLLSEWRAGRRGALVMGLRHGLFCLGCCWMLMGLLFAGGVMNPSWVAAISVFVLAEKVLPFGRAVSWLSGAVLVLWGVAALRAAL